MILSNPLALNTINALNTAFISIGLTILHLSFILEIKLQTSICFSFFCLHIPPKLEQLLVLEGAQINIHHKNEFAELCIYLRIKWKTLEKQVVLLHSPQENALYSKVFMEHTTF